MNALHAIQESYFYKVGARPFFIISGAALAVTAVALVIFYASFISLNVAAIAFKTAKYTIIVSGSSFVIATLSTTIYHIYTKVKFRVQQFGAPVAT